MEIEKAEELANMLDAHCMALLKSNGTQKQAIEWMKVAFNLMGECAKDLRRPRLYAVHNGFGCATYTLERPSLVIPKKAPEGFFDPPSIWASGVTVPYGDRFQNRNQPWTQADTRRLVAQREREKAKLK